MCAIKRKTMGHSGSTLVIQLIKGAIMDGPTRTTLRWSGPDSTMEKIKVFRKNGIKVLDHIGNIGEEMRLLLNAKKSLGVQDTTTR
jgi:hypothetical protein